MNLKEHPIMPRVHKLANKGRRKIEGATVHAACSGAQGKILHYIMARSETELFQKDIEEEFGLRGSSATDLLQKLEKSGLIVRKSVDYDARRKQIVPTEKALEHREEVMRGLEKLEKELVEGIPEEDLEVFCRVLNQMIENYS